MEQVTEHDPTEHDATEHDATEHDATEQDATEQDATELAGHLVAELAERGRLSDPKWRRALIDVPRHLFVPQRGQALPDHPPGDAYPIDAAASPTQWWKAVYSDTAIVTQFDEGATDPTAISGIPTSSISAPGMVAAFLELLNVRDHHRVLEIGTGTGFTAALLSHRVGPGNVVTIEVDASVSAQAAVNLKAVGYTPDLIVGDGAEGWAGRAPYDRIHVTCGVDQIPYAWIEQTRPGGLIALPWTPGHGNGRKAALTRTGATAVGRLNGGASYLMMRAQRKNLTWHAHQADQADQAVTQLDPRALAHSGAGADVAIAALVPGLISRQVTHPGTGEFELLLWDQEATSWAECDYEPGADTFALTTYGPRRLWAEAEDAFHWWVQHGSPAAERFGLTISPEGQNFWLDEPNRPLQPATAEPSHP
jgi:protein-L-isoaspartate(D-aspartate) O-methyltransferase